MPIFEYHCNGCSQRFEVLVRRQNQEVQCPNCQGADLHKLFSAFSSTVSGGSPEMASCPPGGCGSCPDAGFCSMN